MSGRYPVRWNEDRARLERQSRTGAWESVSSPTLGGGGGGSSDHATLSNLDWAASGHTGTASRVAGFNGAGAAAYQQVGVDIQAWDTDLDAAAALGTSGLVTRRAVGDWVTRSIAVSGTGIGIANATGFGGDPTITITPSTIVSSGAAVGLDGLGSAQGSVIYRTAIQWAALGPGTDGSVLQTHGAGANPTWATPSGVLDVIGSTRGSLLYRGAAGWSVLTPGTATHVLTSNGAGADPSWAAPGGGGSATISSSTVTFATGETWVRKTVTDASVSGTSKIIVGVQSPAYADDAADLGWAYSAQVVLRASGSFDVVVHAVPVWGADSSPEGPGTTVTIYYILG